MNVLWLAPTAHSSKAGHPMPWVTTLAARLVAERQAKVTILSYNPFIQHDDERVEDGVRYQFLKVPDDKWDLLRGYTGRLRRMRQYLRDVAPQYDLLHIHGAEQQYHAMGAAVRIPKVLSAQGFVTEYYRHLPRRPEYRHLSWLVAGYYETRYLPTVRHFICRTHWDQAFVRQYQPGAVVHHNWELIRPEFYQPLRPTTHPRPAVLFVGGTNAIKGIREALQTLDALRATRPLRLIVTGAGHAEELHQLAAKLRLRHLRADDLEHRGMLQAAQLWETYHEAFCLLHPSYIDNSPNSVCEAQLAGLPVVASDVGGVASLVESYRTGLLCPLSVPALTRAVGELWDNAPLRASLAAQARAVSLERFDPDRITRATRRIYEEVLTNP
jgi:glycosyltransferase involved in cell wall biosynthesis